MTAALWTLRDVTLSGRSSPRLNRVTTTIPMGTCAIAGPSGAGKTSLLNLLVGFERPTGGVVDGPGSSAASDGEQQSRPSVYWCPPDDGLWPHLTVREHLEVVSPDKAGRSEAVADLLRAFQLSALAEARPDSLSEGERARLSVARAIATGARILVMDEPLSHVNRALRRDCWRVLRQLCAERGASLVFSSHDAETILREAEHVICLDRGSVVWSGPVSELYLSPASRELAEFLGPVNWFEPEDATLWLGKSFDTPRGVRPESLTLTAAADGPFVVEEAASIGNLAEIELRDAAGRRRTFIHADNKTKIPRGARVVLSVVLSSLLALVLAGCGGSAEGNTLPVTGNRSWSLPVEKGVLPAPRAMTFNRAGELLVLDDVGRILVYAADGQLIRKWWMPEYSAGRPEGIIELQDGRLAIADTHYHRVVFFSQTGELLGTSGEYGREPGQFIYPCHLTEDPQGNIYVGEYGGNDRVQKFTPDMKFILEFGEAGTEPGQLQRTGGISWHDGAVYVCDIINNRVQKFSDEGKLLGALKVADGVELEYPYDIAIGKEGRVDIIEYKSGRLSQVALDGELQGRYGKTGRKAGEFWTPWGIASTPDGRIVVADTGNRRIVELTL
jgi:ABC-type multidrug transport system ATPase subunit/sugar lactone lactonase YvrE